MYGSIKEIEPIEVRSAPTGELYTIARLITEGTGISDFSVIHEELPPGHRSSSPHYHSKQDEMYFVLSGSPTVHINGNERVIHSGCYVVFKSGGKNKHVLENNTKDMVEVLKISSCPTNDVITY